MKKQILFAILLATQILFAQSENDKKIFLDSLSRETTEEKHSFYIIIKDYYRELPEYETSTYYKSGKISRIATIKNKKILNNISGHSIGYYESGAKRNESFPHDENNPILKYSSWFENGNLEQEKTVDFKKKIQFTKEFYENGNPKVVLEYNFNDKEKVIQFWDKNNKQLIKDGNGNYLVDNDKEKISGTIKNGYKVGNWSTFNKIKKEYLFENFDNNGNPIRKETTESSTQIDNTQIDNTIYSLAQIETQPIPKKGLKDFTTHIQKTLKYSEEAVKNKVDGRIFIEFVIEKDGKISDIKLLKGLGYGLDEEAIRVISNYGNWIPGQQRGKKVRVRYSLPIMISLK
jgi:TonB family protein